MNYCKYLILVIVASLGCSGLCAAQSGKIDGFSTYKFGTAPEIIKKDFPAKWQGTHFQKFEKGVMQFAGGVYLGFPVSQWKFEFFGDKLAEVEIIFAPAENKKEKDGMVSALEQSITKQYFQSKTTMRNEGGSFFWIETNRKEEVAGMISLSYDFDSLEVTLAFTDYPLHVRAMRTRE